MGDKYLPSTLENEPNNYFSHLSIANGAFSPTGTFSDVYMGVPFPQNSNQRNQNKSQDNMYQYQDLTSWENIKIPEKMDLIELSSKDLSPVSYCSNIDLLMPDTGSQYNNSNWYLNTNNYNFTQCEYPVNKYAVETNRFCDVQKPNGQEQGFKSCAYYNSSETHFPEMGETYCKKKQEENLYTHYNAYCDGGKYFEPSNDNFYLQNNFIDNALAYGPMMTPIDQQTEISNEESDIIVEDSEEDQTDYSEDQEKKLVYEASRCLICNTQYTPLGVQFYILTAENPLTMSTQTTVINKIIQLVGCVEGNRNFLCSDCLSLVNTIDHLQQKLESFTKDLISKFKVTCYENNVNYRRTSYVKRPIKFKRYKCNKCKRIYSLKAFFQRHLQRHKLRGHLCEYCGKILLTLKHFKMHVRNHRKKDVPMIQAYRCSNENCNKTFRTKSNLKLHRNYCLGILPFKCKDQYCDKKFASATLLKNHNKLKHDQKFVAICSICNIGFIKPSDYKSHMISHSTDKKYQCTKCDKAYKTLSNLNFHLKSHKGKLPFVCAICQKGYMRKEYLEAHINNHKGIKNFACTMCDKKCVSQKNLDSHLKRHETTSKKVICNVCKKTITTDFEEHMRVHSNLREFECDLCDMRFNTKNTLFKHRKKKHSNTTNMQ